MAELDSRIETPTASLVPPGKVEAPVPVLVGRWMLLGCGATLAVIAVAFLFWGYVVIRGVAK